MVGIGRTNRYAEQLFSVHRSHHHCQTAIGGGTRSGAVRVYILSAPGIIAIQFRCRVH